MLQSSIDIIRPEKTPLKVSTQAEEMITDRSHGLAILRIARANATIQIVAKHLALFMMCTSIILKHVIFRARVPLEQEVESLRRFHPNATAWVSPIGLDEVQLEGWFAALDTSSTRYFFVAHYSLVSSRCVECPQPTSHTHTHTHTHAHTQQHTSSLTSTDPQQQNTTARLSICSIVSMQ